MLLFALQTKPPVNKHLFKILRGRVDPKAADFCHFRESFCLCWDSVGDVLEALQKLLRDFAVPSADVHGERLVELCHCWENSWTKTPSAATLLSALDNQKEVLDLVSRPGQRYRGEGGAEAAAVRIQSSWRSYLARRAHLYHCRRKWAAGIIAVSWLLYTQRQHVRKALQAKRSRQLENNRSRAQVMLTPELCSRFLTIFTFTILSDFPEVSVTLWKIYASVISRGAKIQNTL